MKIICFQLSLVRIIVVTIVFCNLFLLLLYVVRSHRILNFIDENGHLVDSNSIMQSLAFKALVEDLSLKSEPPLIIFLNRHAINITINWLCNTIDMENVHDRILITAVDEEVKKYFAVNWPKIAVFYFPVEQLKAPFSSCTSLYQLMYFFRANLALSLVKSGISFWMTQQDTLWTRNFLEPARRYSASGDFDALFDRHGFDDGIERETINGAHWFIRANERSAAFLASLVEYMKRIYTPDAAILTMLCHNQPPLANCAFLPYSVSSRGSWILSPGSRGQSSPSLLQFDLGSPASKAETMKEFGAWLVDDTGKCNYSAITLITNGDGLRNMKEKVAHLSMKNVVSDFNSGIFDYLQRIPVIGQYFTRYGLISVYYIVFWEGWE